MEIEAWAANRLATEMAFILSNGHVDVFDQNGDRLVRLEFANPAFAAPLNGAVAAYPFKPAIAERDGRPVRFEARDFDDVLVLQGTAGYRNDDPPPEMKFRARTIVQDADVMIDSFVFSLAG